MPALNFHQTNLPASHPLRRFGGVIAAVVLAIVLAPGGCSKPQRTPLPSTISPFGFDEVEVGPVTFFTRMEIEDPSDLRPDEMKAIISAYDLYGNVQPVWIDKQRKMLDITVGGAKLEFAGSYLQENLDLARDGNVPWRLVWVRYRENFAARMVSFRISGKVQPDVDVAVDAGDGFQPVDVEEDGRYEVLVPFSASRRVAFVRMTTGTITQYGQIRPGQREVEQISFEEYQRARREAAPVPDVPVEIPEPLPDPGPEGQPQTRPQSRPGEGANLDDGSGNDDTIAAGSAEGVDDTVKDPADEGARAGRTGDPATADEGADADDDDNDDNGEIGESGGFATGLPYPPKVLTRQVSIEVHLVFEGIKENDPIIDDLRQLLIPYNFQRESFDAETGLYWMFCKVLDIGDIRRIHQAIRSWASSAEIPLVSRSRYFGVKMELVRLAGELVTTVRGTIQPNATLTLWPNDSDKPVTVKADALGRYETELDPSRDEIPGRIVDGERTIFVRINVWSGDITTVRKSEWERLRGLDKDDGDNGAPGDNEAPGDNAR